MRPPVAAWNSSNLSNSFYISLITILEIRSGIELLRRKDIAQARALDSWFQRNLKSEFEGRILPITQQIAEKCGELDAARTRPFRDALILATAIVHHLDIVTRDETDFIEAGVIVINPWKK